MGIDEGEIRVDPVPGGPGHPSSGPRTGMILSLASLGVWLLVVVAVRGTWLGYDPDEDVLLFRLILGGASSAAMVLVGGAAAVTLAAVGGVMSLARAARGADRPAIVGIVASLVGLSPLGWFAFRVFTA